MSNIVLVRTHNILFRWYKIRLIIWRKKQVNDTQHSFFEWNKSAPFRVTLDDDEYLETVINIWFCSPSPNCIAHYIRLDLWQTSSLSRVSCRAIKSPNSAKRVCVCVSTFTVHSNFRWYVLHYISSIVHVLSLYIISAMMFYTF